MLGTINKDRKSKIEMAKNLNTFQVKEEGIELKSEVLNYDLIFYTNDIVRIHQYNGSKDTNPYSVVQSSQPVEFSIEENEESIVVISKNLDVVINKSPILFTFLNKEGKVINKDDKGLGTQRQGTQSTVYKELQDGERFVGLGEKTGPLDRRGNGYENWNTDHFAYDIEADPLYASIPFYIGIHDDTSYGIFVDNSYKSHFNFGASNNRFSSFSVDAGDMDYYFINGSVSDIIKSYTWLTGRMSMPPLWSIGYQQCRYSYYPDTEVLDVAKKFRYKEISADVIVLDIHYMEKYKIFTWDNERFPNPKQMINHLKELGFEVVVICDPGIKMEEGYEAFVQGVEEDVFLKYPDGSYYEGEVWPGWCNFPDFSNPKTRAWWEKMMKSYTDIGIKGFWNDMNEIATWGQKLPDNIEFDFEGEGGTTRKGRNIYGMQMARSAFESAKANLDNKRPFNLTRAGFAGIQRYSALWTGDNVANDDHMMLGIRMVNSLGLSGVAFSGYDVGGFAGNGQSGLFARWIQAGAFSPFYRGHSTINTNDSEPWAYGEEVEEISKNYIRLRYKLLPYIYNAFLVASEEGLPITRSLCLNYASDASIYEADFENQYLFGESILVAPVRSDTNYSKVYLPEGDWYEFFTDEKIRGGQELLREYALEHLPLFVKASSIIPIYPDVQENSQNVGDVLELHFYQGKEENSFDYYEDDGVSYDYENDQFYRRTIHLSPNKNQIKIGQTSGAYQTKIKKVKCVLHGFDPLEVEGLETMNDTYSFVCPISNFDPFEKDNRDNLKIENVQSFEIANTNEEMVFSW